MHVKSYDTVIWFNYELTDKKIYFFRHLDQGTNVHLKLRLSIIAVSYIQSITSTFLLIAFQT